MFEMLGQSVKDSWLIYILMFGICLGLGGSCIANLRKYAKEFKQVAENIRSKAPEIQKLQEYLMGEKEESVKLFSNAKLQKNLEEYCKTYRRTVATKGAAPFVDLTDFFNRDYLDEIGWTGLCNLIPGTMTGLGILGTFWGLVMGVSGFDTSTTVVITSSISGLLGGMGTAFLTSIAGVLCSFGFSYLYQPFYEKANKALEEFTAEFHDKNLDGSASKAENQLLEYQRQQTELMQGLTQSLADSIGRSIAQAMRTEIAPVFEEMKKTIEEFSTVASRDQRDSLEQVVQEFIRCMNNSLQGQFEELGHMLQQMCEWQKTSMQQTQQVLDGMAETVGQIERIHEISQQTVEQMGGFVSKLDGYQAEISAQAEQVNKRLEQGNEISQRQADYIDRLVESETRIAQLSDAVRQQAKAAQDAVNQITEHCKDQMSEMLDAAKTHIETLADSTKVLVEASQQQMDTLAQTAESEMEMLSETASRLSEENHQQLMTLSKASSEQMTLLSSASEQVMKNGQQQIEVAIAAVQTQSDALMQAANDFAEFVQQQNSRLVDAVEKEVKGLNGFTRQVVDELKNASAGIGDAAKLLDQNMDQSLKRTFDSFDSGLTDIAQHLSGTIADVRDTTEALPHVIREAQQQYKAVLQDLAEQTKQYMAAVQRLTDTMKRQTQAAQSEEGNRQ